MKTYAVRSCHTCPFFVQTTGSFLAMLSILTKEDAEQKIFGECAYPIGESGDVNAHPMGAVGAEQNARRDRQERRLRTKDATQPPQACPLRVESVHVGLAADVSS